MGDAIRKAERVKKTDKRNVQLMSRGTHSKSTAKRVK